MGYFSGAISSQPQHCLAMQDCVDNGNAVSPGIDCLDKMGPGQDCTTRLRAAYVLGLHSLVVPDMPDALVSGLATLRWHKQNLRHKTAHGTFNYQY